jgi:beta-N-acetylhexosaminidase
MSAHVVFRTFDAEHPATTSARVLNDLLRSELHFQGACFTDCAEMQAVAGGVGTETAAVLALRAGADCVVISHHLDLARRTCDAIVAALEDGRLPLQRLEQALDRLAALREFAEKGSSSIPDGFAHIDEQAGAEVARRAVTRIRGEVRLHGPATIVSFEGATAEGVQTAKIEHPSLALALRERKVHAELLRVSLDPSADMVEQLVTLLRAQEGREVVLLSRRAHAHASQREALDALLAAAPDALLVALREPFDVTLFPAARNVVCALGDGEVSVAALADVLSGRQPAVGRLPVALTL